jgi:16S rRNA G966 N2-methylase RsmD
MLSKYLIGGEETISLMEYLGLIFPCEIDPSIMVPYVHLFPLDVDIVESKNTNPDDILTNASTSTSTKSETILEEHDIPQKQTSSIIFVTDCHPTVLSRTTVGKVEDGAVMYIGPDSLALIQHILLQLHVTSLGNQSHNNNDNDGSKSGNFRILDFCTGSGIQAMSTLVCLKCYKPNAKATFVDVNNRALRFARFNAMLSGIEEERISTINTDINSGNGVVFRATECDEMSNRIESTSMDEEEELFDIILANPPFIPVPDAFENIPSDDRSKNSDESITDII